MAKFEEVKDSGRREAFGTGSVRDTREGKGRYDLLPPAALRRLAVHYENGARKYGDRNWEKGQPVSRYIDSALRHLVCFMDGQRDEDHLAAAAWNVFGAIHTGEKVESGELPAELDDVWTAVDGGTD
jgi:hypothetical protein